MSPPVCKPTFVPIVSPSELKPFTVMQRTTSDLTPAPPQTSEYGCCNSCAIASNIFENVKATVSSVVHETAGLNGCRIDLDLISIQGTCDGSRRVTINANTRDSILVSEVSKTIGRVFDDLGKIGWSYGTKTTLFPQWETPARFNIGAADFESFAMVQAADGVQGDSEKPSASNIVAASFLAASNAVKNDNVALNIEVYKRAKHVRINRQIGAPSGPAYDVGSNAFRAIERATTDPFGDFEIKTTVLKLKVPAVAPTPVAPTPAVAPASAPSPTRDIPKFEYSPKIHREILTSIAHLSASKAILGASAQDYKISIDVIKGRGGSRMSAQSGPDTIALSKVFQELLSDVGNTVAGMAITRVYSVNVTFTPVGTSDGQSMFCMFNVYPEDHQDSGSESGSSQSESSEETNEDGSSVEDDYEEEEETEFEELEGEEEEEDYDEKEYDARSDSSYDNVSEESWAR